MGPMIEIPGNEQPIGHLSVGVLAKAKAAMEVNRMGNAVEIQMPSQMAVEPARSVMTPMEMMDRAIANGASIEMLEKLMGMQERYEANQARKAFDAAISEAKAKIPPIIRNATGHNQKRYADFSAIARVVDPILSAHGLSYRFKTSQSDRVTVTCIISHKDGHAEETSLSGAPDTSGNKNSIQAIGSTLSYLSRYSLMAALGLSASNDDDGAAAGRNEDQNRTISPEQVKIILQLLDETGSDIEKFCQIGKIDAVPEMLASQFDSAVQMLNQKKAKMQRATA